MPLPAAAAAITPLILPALKEVKEQVKHPVIGYSKTVEKQTKKKRITKSYKFELRAWEVGAGVLGIGSVMIAAYMTRMWAWKKWEITSNGKTYAVHLPAACTSHETDIFGQTTQAAVAEVGKIAADLIKIGGGSFNPFEGWGSP